MNKNLFSERLTILRKNLELTQQELCDKLQINVSSYRHYETANNIHMPIYETLIKLSEFFNVSIDYLLGLTDNPQKH